MKNKILSMFIVSLLCIAMVNAGLFDFFRSNTESNGEIITEVSIQNNEYKATFYPENIIAKPFGANGNFTCRGYYSIDIEDFRVDTPTLDIEAIYLEDDSDKSVMNIKHDYGQRFEYDKYNETLTCNYTVNKSLNIGEENNISYQECYKVENISIEVYNNKTQSIEINYSLMNITQSCDYIEGLDCKKEKSYISKDYNVDGKWENINHKRTITGYFDVPCGSTGKFNVYVPFIGMIDPTWVTDSSNFTNGTFTNTFLNGTFVQLNLSLESNGSYLSEIINAGGNSQWNNISWFTEVNYSGELPNSQVTEDTTYFLRGANMTGNVLLMHLNNDSVYGENDTHVFDFSGNGNNGTVNGSSVTSDGKFNGAFDFDGVNDYINLSNPSNLQFGAGDNYSISVWIKDEDLTGGIFHTVLGNGKITSTDKGYNIFIDNNNKIGFGHFDGSAPSPVLSGTTNVNDSQWHHVGVVWTADNSRRELYIDGVIEDDNSSETNTGNISNLNFFIGIRSSTTLPFNGTIDEVAIWNRSLSVTEIEDIYKRGAVKLNLSVRSCNDENCSGENFTDIVDISPQDLSVDNNTYFQYNFSFESENYNFTPQLYNVTTDFTILDNPPIVNLVVNESSVTLGVGSVQVNCSAYNGETNLSSFNTSVFFPNGSLLFEDLTANMSEIFTPTNLTVTGQYNVSCFANDSIGQSTTNTSSFNVTLIPICRYRGFKNESTDAVLQFTDCNGNMELRGNLTVNESTTIARNLTIGNTTFIDNQLFINMRPEDSQSISKAGDAGINGLLLVNDSIIGFARTFGFGLAISSLETGFEARFSLGGTGTFNATTNLLCDSTDPFFANDTGQIIATLSTLPVNIPFVGEIVSFVNSTCVEINPAAVPVANQTDLSVVIFGIAAAPMFYILDNGVFVSNIGETPEASFKINALNSTGEDAVEIIQKSGTDDTHVLHVESDAFNFSGITLIHTLLQSTIAQTAADIMSFVAEIDLSNFNNSDYNVMEFNILSDGVNNTKTGIEFIGNFTRYLHSGNQEPLNKSWYDNTTDLINTTNSFTSSDDNIPIFEFDDSVIYIQNDINFTRIGITLEVGASGTILPLFFYCNSTGQYENLAVTDGTSGFTDSGTISFTNPINRGKCNQDINGVNFTDTANYSTIAIQRTRNFIVTPPTESIFSITGEEEEFVLAEDFIQLKPISSPPGICGANIESRAYYDLDINKWCYCDGTNFVQFDDSSTVCS